MLFNLYINDLPDCIMQCHNKPAFLGAKAIPLLMYADDLILLSENDVSLQKALDALSQYCTKWQLRVNVMKTKIIIFNSRIHKGKYNFLYQGQIVEIVSNYTYLGLVFTNSRQL